VERALSVSSMRSRNLPPSRRANSQLNSAVLAPPTCKYPVGDGANRTRIVTGNGGGGIRTPDRVLKPYNGLANRRLQPLGHPSNNAALELTGFDAAMVPYSRCCRDRTSPRLKFLDLAGPVHNNGAATGPFLRSHVLEGFRLCKTPSAGPNSRCSTRPPIVLAFRGPSSC